MVGDFDRDGKADLAVWRASTGWWYWLTSSSDNDYTQQRGVQWGTTGDVPMVKHGLRPPDLHMARPRGCVRI